MDKQKLYAIKDLDTGHVKIGRSIDPENRLVNLRSQEGKKNLKILIVREVRSARDSEKALHEKFQKYNVAGEWFNLSEDMIEDLEGVFNEMQSYGEKVNVYKQNTRRINSPNWDQIREAVRIELTKRKVKQVELAKKLEMSKQQLSQIIRGETGNIPESWQKLFNELDWELVPIPKNKVINVKKMLVE